MAFSYDNIPYAALDEAVSTHFADRALKETNSEYNFVCPFCGDMHRPNKKKAYVYKDTWQFICYKCGQQQHVMKYFKENADDIYTKLLFMGFDDEGKERKEKKAEKKTVPSDLPFMEGELISILDNHPLAKRGLELCKHRMIRPVVYEKWYVCLEGEQFLLKDSGGAYLLDENGRPIGNKYKNRLIIPFYKFGGAWHQFDARDLNPESSLRYLNFKGAKREAYNIDFIDYDKPFYILEGTIDSTFIKNSIAIGGVKFLKEVIEANPEIEKYKENCTIIWDNDDPGRNARLDSVKMGFKWFDWTEINEKDVNGAVMKGEMPLDKYGFVDREFIEARSRPAEGAEILFSLQYGDMKRRDYLERRANRQMLREKMKANNVLGIHF